MAVARTKAGGRPFEFYGIMLCHGDKHPETKLERRLNNYFICLFDEVVVAFGVTLGQKGCGFQAWQQSARSLHVLFMSGSLQVLRLPP